MPMRELSMWRTSRHWELSTTQGQVAIHFWYDESESGSWCASLRAKDDMDKRIAFAEGAKNGVIDVCELWLWLFA